eukprot:13102392-Alexandrium_andersonii.AAC.1
MTAWIAAHSRPSAASSCTRGGMYSKGARTLGQRVGQTADCDKACASASGVVAPHLSLTLA